MQKYEVFHPADGKVVVRVPFACLASFICKLFNPVVFLDWSLTGEGWVN